MQFAKTSAAEGVTNAEASPPLRLEARIAGLEREAELLEETLADPTPEVEES